MMNLRVDRLTEDDWETLREIRLRSLVEDGEVFGASIERERGFKESHWRMRLRGSPWFVAIVREFAVGLVCVIREPGAEAEERHIVAMWVSPEQRGTGVGDALVTAAEAWAREDGAERLTVWLLDGNAAAECLCQRAGFAPTGERVATPRDPRCTEERWSKTITGVQGGLANRSLS